MLRKPRSPPSSSAMPASTRTSVSAGLSSTWAKGRSRASQLTKVPLRSAIGADGQHDVGALGSPRTRGPRGSRGSRPRRERRPRWPGRPGRRCRPPPTTSAFRSPVCGSCEDAGGVATWCGRHEIDAPRGGQVDARCGVAQRATTGQQVGEQTGLERAALTGSSRHPTDLRAGRRGEVGDGGQHTRRRRRPLADQDHAASVERDVSQLRQAPATTDASVPGVALTRLPCSFSRPRDVCELTAWTRVPW